MAGQADALLIADGSCEPVERPLFDLVRIAYNDPNVDWQKFDLDRDMKFLDEKMVPSTPAAGRVRRRRRTARPFSDCT